MKQSDSEILDVFARNVRIRRMNLGISQEKLAELANLHRTYIGMIERSEKNITLKNIQKISSALGVSPADLLSF
ncbi:MAG: helix-turn-helix transcriptional regulator [Muribaculaceae bacterium]|nr:helix-turn-helix transcriptional regulator [Muribaculaceae bacterium]